MTTLSAPSLERRLLQTLKEEVEDRAVRTWPEESVELFLAVLRQIRGRTAGMLKALNERLAEGVEARSFAREYAPLLAAAEERTASIRECIARLSSSDDSASARVLRELEALEAEEKAYLELLADTLARVSSPLPSLDWDRLKRESDADLASGRSVRFTTAEEMLEGLAGPD